MLVRIDPSSDHPLHMQIAANIRRQVGDGKLAPGERLPAARDLADALGVHLHTVLRAYRSLHDDGVVEMRRGRGATRVRKAADGTARIIKLVDDVADEARQQGLTRHEVMTLLRERWS